jgi:hypothetical protein
MDPAQRGDPSLVTNPNAPVPLTWDTDDHGTWTAYLGWNGLGLVVLAETGGSAIVLDDADLGLLNSGILGPTADGWTDLGCDLMSLEIERGATVDGGVLLRPEAGGCRLVLDNTNLTYEPFVSASFPLGLGTSIAVLGDTAEDVEIVAGDPSLNPWQHFFGLFRGKIDSLTAHGYGTDQLTAHLVAVDDTAQLQNYNGLEQSPVGAGDTTEERLNRVLDNANWSVYLPSADFTATTCEFDQDTDANPTHQATTLAQPAWEELLRTADAANRVVCFDGRGVPICSPLSVTIFDTWSQWTWGCVEGVDILTTSLDVLYDKSQLINTVDAARVGGSQVTVTDTTSMVRHGEFRWGRNDLTLENDVDVESFAGFIVQWSAEPVPRVTGLRVSPSVWPTDTVEVTRELWEDAGLVSSSQVAGWTALCEFISQPIEPLYRHIVSAPIFGTSETITDTVAMRGVRLTLDADVAEVDFVTSSVRQFLDLFIFDDAEFGRLNRGHRVA